VEPALAYPGLTLRTGAHVAWLQTSPSGREVREVVVERHGACETYTADIVVVSAGAINSVALLLRSANDRHPRGLANGSDVGSEEWSFAMGHISFVGKLDAHSLRAGAPPRSRRSGRST
jgi:choline dehydrogenase-like flavoprotein